MYNCFQVPLYPEAWTQTSQENEIPIVTLVMLVYVGQSLRGEILNM